MPGRVGYLSAYFLAIVWLTGRKPYWASRSCGPSVFVKRMNLFARSRFGLFLRTAIGSWISIVWRGITYGMSVPTRRELRASLSYVSRTSPLPARNVFVALRPDVSCETTCWKSFVT